MGFWEDSSPIVKVALVIGVLGLLYMALAWGIGFAPFPSKCSYEPEPGTEVSGCPENATCIDGECVQQQRGL